jgi:hypothetical protein
LQDHPKFTQRDFWFENMPSGNPVIQTRPFLDPLREKNFETNHQLLIVAQNDDYHLMPTLVCLKMPY